MSNEDQLASLESQVKYLKTVGKLEDELAAAKADGKDTRKVKDRLRDARREYREEREAAAAPTGAARPTTIEASASVED